MARHTTDAVIVGAGPAGAATAIFLARRGYSVALLERAAVPRAKPCGEYLTPGAVNLLRDELGVLSQLTNAGAVPVTRETVVAHDGKAFGGATTALACPRLITDDTLRRAAAAAGVSVVEGFSVRRILFDGGAVTGVAGTGPSGEETFSARVTVGADGTHSLLARALNVVRPLPRLQKLAIVAHFTADSWENTHAVTMYLPSDRSNACCGVGAPCGANRSRNVNIVVPVSEARLMAGRTEDHFRDTLKSSFPRVSEMVSQSSLAGKPQTIGCFAHHTARATHDGAVLVGDAATFIHPFTGEGVFFALRGAQLAADAIHGALRVGNVSRNVLISYDAARKRELLPRYRLCDTVQRVVHSPSWLAWAGERLRRAPSLTDILLSTVGDIATPRDLWSLGTLRVALGAG